MKRILLIGLALLACPAAFAQTMTFTVETSTSGGSAVVPRLTWTSTPAGAVCSASAVPVAADWAGTKPAAGTVLLAAINATRSYTLVCNWPSNLTATVTWTAPTLNTDNSPLTNLAGYRIVYGRTSIALDTVASVNSPTVLTWTSPTLAAGTWFFAVKALNTTGIESDVSNVASKTLVAGASQTRTLEVAVKFPNPPSNVQVE